MPYVAIGCTTLLTIVFVASAALKVRSRAALNELAQSLTAMRLISHRRSRPVAIAVSVVEIGTVVALLSPAGPAYLGFWVAGLLLGLLTLGILVSMHRTNGVHCRCFGASALPLGRVHVARNLLLMTVSGLGAVSAKTGGAADSAGVTIAVSAGALGAAVLIGLDHVIDLLTPLAAREEKA